MSEDNQSTTYNRDEKAEFGAALHTQDSGTGADWVDAQKRAFTRWANRHLKEAEFEDIEDCYTAFDDGVKLMELMNALYGIEIPKHRAGVTQRVFKLDNMTAAFAMVERAGVVTNFLKHEHLVDHDEKMILGMLWSFILHYSINKALHGGKGLNSRNRTASTASNANAKKLMLDLANEYTSPDYPEITNFTSCFANGMAFCDIIAYKRKKAIDMSSLNPDNALENLTLAFDKAEEYFGMAKLIDPIDIVDAPRIDSKTIMMYIGELVSQLDLYPNEVDIVPDTLRAYMDEKLAAHQRHIDTESRTSVMVSSINERTEKFANENAGPTGLSNYYLNELRSLAQEDFLLRKAALVNHCEDGYLAPEEHSSDSKNLVWNTLLKAETAYSDLGDIVEEYNAKAAAMKELVLGLTTELDSIAGKDYVSAEEALSTKVSLNRFSHACCQERSLLEILGSIREREVLNESTAYFVPDDTLSPQSLKADWEALDSRLKDVNSELETYLAAEFMVLSQEIHEWINATVESNSTWDVLLDDDFEVSSEAYFSGKAAKQVELLLLRTISAELSKSAILNVLI